MADKKISALTSLAQGDVAASTDVLPIVDTSATETKKITASALVGAGMTAGVTNVDINSGAIDGTTIGANSAAAGTFTTLTGTTKVVSPYVDAVGSAGGQLRNASGTSQLAWGAGGGSNLSLEVATNINPANAAVSIAPTGTGTVTINPATAGTMNNVAIGGSTAAAGSFTTLTTSSTVTLNGGTANGVLYLNGSKVATSGSALVFDGSNLGVGATATALTTYRGAEFAGTTATTGGFLRMRTSDSSINSLDFTDSNGRAIFTTTNHPVRIGVNDTEVLRFTSSTMYTASGINVGIGTSSPAGRLHVVGTNDQIRGGDGTTTSFLGGSSGNGYTGTLTNHPFLIYTNSAIRATFDTSGNLGLGVTPSAWGGGFKAIQMTAGASFGSHPTVPLAYVNANTFFDGSVNKYISSAFASRFISDGNSGGFGWQVAASGTAGNTISFTQAMTLTAAGDLSFGVSGAKIGNTTLPGGDFKVVSEYDPNSTLTFWGADSVRFRTYNGSTWGERGRFTAGGYFKASDDGTYVEASQCHELRTTEDARAAIITATNASYTSDITQIRATRNTTNNSFYALTYYNTGATAYKFQVADSGNVTNTNNSYGAISDAKMKTDIVDAGSQWADIKAVRFRKFKMKNDPQQITQLGVVAQELEQTSPGLVDEHADRDAEGNDLGTTTKSVKSSILLMKSAVALQEAMARIEQLEAKVAALESK
jgi:hypothetical protein